MHISNLARASKVAGELSGARAALAYAERYGAYATISRFGPAIVTAGTSEAIKTLVLNDLRTNVAGLEKELAELGVSEVDPTSDEAAAGEPCGCETCTGENASEEETIEILMVFAPTT